MVPPRVLKTINKHIRIPRNAYHNQNTTMFDTQNDITSNFIGFSSNVTQKRLPDDWQQQWKGPYKSAWDSQGHTELQWVITSL